MKAKLTPTTNDVLKGGKHIAAAHEPLATGEMPSHIVANPLVKLEQIVTAVQASPEKKKRKIAIVGTAPSSRGLAPIHDPSWEIWACSAGNMGQIARVDRWFEIHCNMMWPEHLSWGQPYVVWLNQQTFPIYMQDASLVTKALRYPVEEMVNEFGRYFFTSSFAWMMAMAIKEGVDTIGLWGVDMASKDEYILQRSGGHHFLQEAVKRGIEVILPKESDLAQPPPLYGFDDNSNYLRKMMVRKKELTERISSSDTQAKVHTDTANYLRGALEDIDYCISIWGGAQSEVRSPVVPNSG